MNKTKTRVSDVIHKSDIEAWNYETPVIISAGTDTGKSYFIKNRLYEYAKEHKQKILFLIHRTNCLNQFQEEVMRSHKDDVIDLMTYQKLDAMTLAGIQMKLSKYRYIVSDEFHYFISDAKFNHKTDVSLKLILECDTAVKIFMSATSAEMAVYISHYCNRKPKVYQIDRDWSFIRELKFYYKDSEESFAKDVIANNEKAIIFMDSAKKAYSLFEKYRDYAVFNCSKSNNTYYPHVDSQKITDILTNERFEDNLLITTSCFDAGVNIIDTDLHKVYIDIKDLGSLIQCIGRKRIQSSSDYLDVYIRSLDGRQIGGIISNMRNQLEMASFLKEHTTEEYLKKYPRQQDTNQIVYADFSGTGDKNSCTMKVNDLMFQKRTLDIELFQHIMKYNTPPLSPHSSYLAHQLGRKFNEQTGLYEGVAIIRDRKETLLEYLERNADIEMITPADRQELIEKINVRVNRKLKKNRDLLNKALESEGLPYQIAVSEKRVDENGVRRKYTIWKIKKEQQ